MLCGSDLGHGEGVEAIPRAAFLSHESVPQPLHDLALAGGFGQGPASLEEGAGGATQPLLGGGDGALGGSHRQHRALQLARFGATALQVGQPAHVVAGASLGRLDDGDGTLMRVDGVAQVDAGRFLGHLAQPQDDAQAEAIAHRGAPPRRLAGMDPDQLGPAAPVPPEAGGWAAGVLGVWIGLAAARPAPAPSSA